MRLAFSKPDAQGRRHVILRCSYPEHRQAFSVVCESVLQGRYRPEITQDGRDRLYHFAPKHLERLLLAFPQAEVSPKLDRHLAKVAAEALAAMPAPTIRCPEFDGELWEFQRAGVHWMEQRLRAGESPMINDDMGLGKTVQTLVAALRVGAKHVLVVTSSSGKWAWETIIRSKFPSVECVVVEGPPAKRAQQVEAGARVTITNWETLRGVYVTERGFKWHRGLGEKYFRPNNFELFDREYDLAIFDEFHKAKNYLAQQTAGFLEVRSRVDIYASGTPFLNGPLELWPVLHRIDPARWPDYASYESWLAVKRGGEVVGYRPEAMLELRQWLHARSLRRRKDQVGIDMPDVVLSTVLVDLTPEQRKLYNQIRREGKMQLASGEIRSVREVRALITRLKQACWSPELYGGSPHSIKLVEVADGVDQLVAAGHKAILFSQWKSATRILERELADYGVAYVDSTVKGRRRQEAVTRFNEDPDCHLYIGTIRANQEAITLSAATYTMFTDKDWTPMANDQAFARGAGGGLRGVGVTSPVNRIEFLARDTVEDGRIEAVLDHKQGLFNVLIERDRGAKVSRVVLKDLADLI